MESETPSAPRWRRWASGLCLVLACILLAVGLLAYWAGGVIYDSKTFADRSVSMLEEPAVRTELASRITEQLARAGNQNAVNYRPAFQLAVEAAIDTDTFRSIFRTAVYRTHVAILASPDPSADPTSSALDLSESVSIIVSNLSLPSNASPGQAGSGGLDHSLGDVTRKLTDLHIWQLDDYVSLVTLLGLLGGPLLGVLAVVLSPNRRRTLRRIGWGVLAVGLVLAALVPTTQFVASSRVADAQLARAVSAAVGRVMADLSTLGLWVAAYGLLLAAALRSNQRPRPTPVSVWARFRAWVDRRQTSTGGKVVLGLGALVLGAYVAGNAGQVLRWAVIGGGVWLSYLGVTELTRMVRFAPPVLDETGAVVRSGGRSWGWHQVALVGGVATLVVLLLGAGAFVTTRRAARTAAAAGAPECNGTASLCDVPLDVAMFAGSHNAMSSALYPGWLFAEQTSTIKGQLDAGIRALLIDTHYGVPSTARLPGSETPLIITDRAAELAAPPGDSYDPAIAARAQQVAANAPPKAGAERDIYLCHNFCEMGAASFAGQMTVLKQWLDTHPDQVVITIIEDHTRPDETAAELQAAGLEDRAWTLDPTRPMPTLGQMIDAGRNLLVFAENGGPGSPPWYQSAYSWFQETPYTWSSVDEMDCRPNRGAASNKLMLINHWVGYSPPDPGRAGSTVNTGDELRTRIQQCIDERGVLPNIVAVDFAERGDLVQTVRDYDAALQRAIDQVRRSGRTGATDTTTPSAGAGGTTLPTVAPNASPAVGVTSIGSLTGGNPAAFCAGAAAFVRTMASWSLADLSKPQAAAGLPALTHGPLVARQIAELAPSTPDELAVQFGPAARQAEAAVAALRQAGYGQADIDALADAAQAQLAGGNPDPGLVEQQLVDLLEARSGHDAAVALATSFDAAHPTTADVFDLGDVSDSVANDSGYGCLAILGS